MNQPPSNRIPTQERAIRTRAALVGAAQREFSTRGYAATTARSIAVAAGVSTGSFYTYFVDKDAVLRELGASRLGALAEQVVGLVDGGAELAGVDEVLRGVIRVVIEYHREDPGFHAVLTERRAHDPELDALTTRGGNLLTARIAGLLRVWGHEGDAEASAFVIHNMVEGNVHAHVLGHAILDDARFLDALVRAVSRVALPLTGS